MYLLNTCIYNIYLSGYKSVNFCYLILFFFFFWLPNSYFKVIHSKILADKYIPNFFFSPYAQVHFFLKKALS